MKYEVRQRINGNILDNLLFYRGIKTVEDKDKFLNPDYDRHIYDPFLLKDAKKAAERIIKAIENNEKIVIYSDYDADGIPAGVVFHDFLKEIGFSNFINYIPHRHDEGFGLNNEAVESFANDGARLILTLDCGISDISAVNLASEKGIDVIITDHHEPHAEIPKAFAIVNHKQNGCEYPEKILCGSGVAFKLIQAILKINRFGMKEGKEKWLLDMVGMATLSDMVPLTGENRIFASYGLKVLRKSPRKGLMRLFDHLKINQRYITEDDIGFMITPRINAASRMGVPMDAFLLLSTKDEDEAQRYAKHLDHINNERKGVVASLVKEVKKIISERYSEEEKPVIVIGNPDWKPALLGLVANTCAEEFGKPVFLWGRDGDGVIKGSCRSGDTVSVVEIMHKVPEGVMLQYGGHFASGGFSVSDHAIHHLDEYLNKAFGLLSLGEDKYEPQYIDMELRIDEIDWSLWNEIEKMAPFGVNNEKPLFIFRDLPIDSIKTFGKDKNHLEISFKKSNNEKLPAVGFFMSEDSFQKPLKRGEKISLIANLEKSMFRNRPELRLRIVDII